jgi:hypothetical protein
MSIPLSKAGSIVKGGFLSGASVLGCGFSLTHHKPGFLAALFLDTPVAFHYISSLTRKAYTVYRISAIYTLTERFQVIETTGHNITRRKENGF